VSKAELEPLPLLKKKLPSKGLQRPLRQRQQQQQQQQQQQPLEWGRFANYAKLRGLPSAGVQLLDDDEGERDTNEELDVLDAAEG